jgi:hypothetical protein
MQVHETRVMMRDEFELCQVLGITLWNARLLIHDSYRSHRIQSFTTLNEGACMLGNFSRRTFARLLGGSSAALAFPALTFSSLAQAPSESLSSTTSESRAFPSGIPLGLCHGVVSG